MKRKKGIIIMLFGIVIFVIAGIGIWRHHYLKIMNAEPINVYKDIPFEPDTSPKDTSVKKDKTDNGTPSQQDMSPKNTSVEMGNSIEMQPRGTTQPIDNRITPEETDNTGNQTVHHIFSDIIVENLPPKAVAALKDYEAVQLAIPEINKKLKPLLEARPIDWNAINQITEQLKKQNQQRQNALEILALHSKEASKELQATLERKKDAERMSAEEKKEKKEIEEISKQIENMNKLIEDLSKQRTGSNR